MNCCPLSVFPVNIVSVSDWLEDLVRYNSILSLFSNVVFVISVVPSVLMLKMFADLHRKFELFIFVLPTLRSDEDACMLNVQ